MLNGSSTLAPAAISSLPERRQKWCCGRCKKRKPTGPVYAAYSREGRAWEAVEGMPERERKGHNEDESLAERIGLIVCMTCWVCFWVVVVVWEVMQ